MKKLLLSMVAVLVAGNTAANAAIFKNVSGIPEAPAVMNKPLLSNEGNARNKKLLNANIGIIYQLNNLAFTNTTNNTYNGDEINGHNVGLNGDFILNITGKAWARLYVESSWITGYSNGDLGTGDQTKYEIKAVGGYDIFSYKSIDLSVYGGLYHRGISGISTASLAYQVNHTGIVLGTSLTHYTENFITSGFLEGYLTGLYGYGGIGNIYSNSASGGFGVGIQSDIEVINNLWIRPMAKFQMLFAGGLVTDRPAAGDILTFQMATFGLGVSWR